MPSPMSESESLAYLAISARRLAYSAIREDVLLISNSPGHQSLDCSLRKYPLNLPIVLSIIMFRCESRLIKKL